MKKLLAEVDGKTAIDWPLPSNLAYTEILIEEVAPTTDVFPSAIPGVEKPYLVPAVLAMVWGSLVLLAGYSAIFMGLFSRM